MIVLLCALFTLILVLYIFWMEAPVASSPEKTRLLYLFERKEMIYENLRDLNFEYRAGKFPDADYHAMRASLEDEAAQVLAEIDLLEKQEQGARG